MAEHEPEKPPPRRRFGFLFWLLLGGVGGFLLLSPFLLDIFLYVTRYGRDVDIRIVNETSHVLRIEGVVFDGRDLGMSKELERKSEGDNSVRKLSPFMDFEGTVPLEIEYTVLGTNWRHRFRIPVDTSQQRDGCVFLITIGENGIVPSKCLELEWSAWRND